MKQIDVETLNARLLGGHRLVVTRDAAGHPVTCEVEFFDESVPVALFNTYLATGMIAVPKDKNGFAISTEGKKKLKMTRSRW